jgi:hypothetical protein
VIIFYLHELVTFFYVELIMIDLSIYKYIEIIEQMSYYDV